MDLVGLLIAVLILAVLWWAFGLVGLIIGIVILLFAGGGVYRSRC